MLDPVAEGYLAYLADVGRKAPRTIIDVRCTLKRLGEDLAGDFPGTPLWQLPLEAFIQWLGRQRAKGRRPAALAKCLSHARGLLDYAWRIGHAQRNVLDGFDLADDGRRVPPDVLTEAQARALVEACPAGTAHDRQVRLVVLLLYGCGLRTDELLSLDLADVDRERRELIVRRGKGDRQRTIPVPGAVYTELLAYLLERGGVRGPLLRTAAKRRRLSSHVVCRTVRDVAVRAGLGEWVTPRTLRHSYATHLMDRGVDLAIIASLMGHRSPQETGVYLHALENRPRDAVDTLNGHALEGKVGS
jgi:site-specific recombinase XerD